MAKKRYAPSIEAIPQRAVSAAVSRGGGGGQSAGHGEAAAGMYGLASVLSTVNPALRNFSEGRTKSGEMQSPQYVSDMLQGVTKNAVAFKNNLKKAGHSQWNNPHVYRNQIINIAEATAMRDVGDLEGNLELTNKLEALTKRGGDDFREDAIALLQEYQPESRNVEKGAGGFWDMGYGHGYIKGRDALLQQYKAKSLMYQRRAVVDAFHENGRAKLNSFMTTKATLKGAINQDYKANFDEFRDYISQMYNSYPEEGIGYTQSIFDNIINPMFHEMARDPNSDGNLLQAWDKVMGMTRVAYNEEGKESGRVNMFNKFDDISTANGIQTIADMWGAVSRTEDEAFSKQTARGIKREGNIYGAVMPVLKSWDSWSEQHSDFLKENGINPVGFDHLDERNWPKLATALADHPDFRLAATESQHETNRMFLSAFSDVRDAIFKGQSKSYDTKKDRDEDMIAKFAQSVQANPEVLAGISKKVKQAIGDPRFDIHDGTLQAELMSLINPDELAVKFFTENPSISPQGFPFLRAYRTWAQSFIAGEGYDEGVQTSISANHVLADPTATQQQLAQALQEVQDAAVEISETKLDGTLTTLSGLLKKKLEIAPYFTLTTEDRDAMMKDGLTQGETDSLVVEMLANKAKLSQTTAAGFDALDALTTEMYSSSNAAFNSLIPETLSIYANEVQKQMDAIGNVPNRDQLMKSEGIPKAKEQTAKRIALMKEKMMHHYDEAQAQSKRGREKLAEEQLSKMSREDREGLAELDALDAIYAADDESGGGRRDAGAIAGSPEQSLEFITGTAGGRRAEAVLTNKRESKERRIVLEQAASKWQLELAKSKENGSSQSAIRLNAVKAQKSLQRLKSHIVAFEGVHFVKLLDPDGYEVTPVTLEGRADENPLSIRINLETDTIDPRQVLIYESPEELHGLAEELNTLEDAIGVEQGIPGATAEFTDEDIAKASPLLLQQADFFRRTMNVDILAKNPATRALAHMKVDAVNVKNAAMFMTRFPEKLPKGVQAARKFQVLERYANDPTFLTYQGITHTPVEKGYVSSVLASNKAMVEGSMNVKKGITGEEVVSLMTSSQGGPDNVSKYTYTITQPRAARGGSLDMDEVLTGVPLAGIDLGASRVVGGIDRKRGSLNVWEGLLTDGDPEDPKDVLAQELAFASEGVHNPSSMGARWENREAINGWGWGFMAAWLPKEVVEGVSPGKGGSLYKETRNLELSAAKIATIVATTERYRALMDRSVGRGSPELAKAYNKWLLSEPDYFNGKFNKENVFDLRPLPIPAQ